MPLPSVLTYVDNSYLRRQEEGFDPAGHGGSRPFRMVSGSGNNTVRDADPSFGDVTRGMWTSVVWDPDAPAGANFAHPDTLHRADGR
jgi:hypothetical protein